jgi:hypothetical protein
LVADSPLSILLLLLLLPPLQLARPIELNQLTGIAALLTFPLDIEDVLEEERQEAEEKSVEAEQVV